MLKYSVDKWFENSEKLREVICTDEKLKDCDYLYLVKLVVEHILNAGEKEGQQFDSEKITVVDDGHYQGTLLFFIPKKTYQPSAGEYLLTYIEYGSCPVCDALEYASHELCSRVQNDEKAKKTADAFMAICKDLVCNLTKPYNNGWHEDERFIAVADLKK